MTDALADELERLAKEATPGPWTADVDYHYGPIVTDPKGDIVADYTLWEGDRDEARTNAALIANLRNNLPAILSALRQREHQEEQS